MCHHQHPSHCALAGCWCCQLVDHLKRPHHVCMVGLTESSACRLRLLTTMHAPQHELLSIDLLYEGTVCKVLTALDVDGRSWRGDESFCSQHRLQPDPFSDIVTNMRRSSTTSSATATAAVERALPCCLATDGDPTVGKSDSHSRVIHARLCTAQVLPTSQEQQCSTE